MKSCNITFVPSIFHLPSCFSIFICVWYVSIIHSFLESNNIPLYEKQIYAPNYLRSFLQFFIKFGMFTHVPVFPSLTFGKTLQNLICVQKISVCFQLFHNSGYPQLLEKKIAKKPVAQGLQAIIKQNGIPVLCEQR